MTPAQQKVREEKVAYWQPHIIRWRESGLKAKSYCQQHQLNHDQFKYWQYQLAPDTKRSSEDTSKKPWTFIQAKPPADLPISHTQEFELYIGSKYALKIPVNYHSPSLVNLLKLLDGLL
jgi:hypothetical protein